MKIEWLNEQKTRARITRGVFRKQTAIVILNFSTWHFESNDLAVYLTESELSSQLDRDRRKDQPSPWHSTSSLPRAIVHK